MNLPYDLAIVGAGPAGTACALALANSGLRVALVDKAVFPRDKICGDAIPGPTFKALERLPILQGHSLKSLQAKEEVQYCRVFSATGRAISYRWVTYSYNSARMDFDYFLFEKVQTLTGTDIFQDCRISDIRKENGLFTLFNGEKQILSCRMVIGCDGAYSIVGRILRPGLEQQHPCAAVRRYYKGVEGLEPGTNDFFFFRDLLPGYLWIFPLPDGMANVGFGILNQDGEKYPLRQTLERLVQEHPKIAPRFVHATPVENTKGFSLPLGVSRPPLSGDGFLLTGDAASLIDPLQGHGIDHAAISGILAATWAQKALATNRLDGAFLQAYDKAVYDRLGPLLNKSKWMMRILSKASFLLEPGMILLQNERLKNWLVRVAGI